MMSIDEMGYVPTPGEVDDLSLQGFLHSYHTAANGAEAEVMDLLRWIEQADQQPVGSATRELLDEMAAAAHEIVGHYEQAYAESRVVHADDWERAEDPQPYGWKGDVEVSERDGQV